MNNEEIISSFQWTDAWNMPVMPIDPGNYQQMKTALAWAFRERLRRRINTVHEDDTFWINDSDYLQRFIEALRLRIEEMEDRDHAKLAAWNRGEPIRCQ